MVRIQIAPKIYYWFKAMAESNTTDGGRIVKMEVDYSSTCDDKIPICKVMAAEGKLNEALEVLLSLEKQTRTVGLLYPYL